MLTETRTIAIPIVILLGLLLAGFSATVGAQTPEDDRQEGTAQQGEQAAEEQPVKLIKLYVEQWKWSPNQIRVKKGTRLKIEALSWDASRRFDLKAYKLKVALPEGKKVTFEFVADKVGKFGWKCGRPCGNGCAKLHGKLIVED
jgi:heme/copper-type cytochrome/quinol oxidase subunit 2